MGSRGGTSSGYNSRGNEYTNRFKDREYANSVRRKMKKYSDKDIDDAMATIQDGMKFNNEQMKVNMAKPLAGQHNYGLYERNVQLENDLKEFQFEKKKRTQEKKQGTKQAKQVLAAMKDAGMKPKKSVEETAKIIKKFNW